ncbi:MAG: type II toxin-antitoxin system RelE/ParE family toxin [Bacteroidetes bacterium]|nr:type II toxin-antitoxin system RelE/ParE family toxin [Bacteroidota bacterium]
MTTEFLKSFSKDIDKIKIESVLSDIESAILNAEESLNQTEIRNLKKLKGFQDAYRIRIGNYRIGIFIDGEKVTFARVIHRKDIYKEFP